MDRPNYYGIIPAKVRYDENLPFLEKFLYCEFTALSNIEGYCYSSNQYFANLYKKDKATISRAISHLEELKYIYIEYEKIGCSVKKRKIYPLDIKTTNDIIINREDTTNDKNITREQKNLINTVDKIVNDNNITYKDIIKLILEKEKNILKKENKFIPPTLEEIEEYAKSRGRGDLARKFYDYYSVGNWKDREGKKLKNWKQKFIVWTNKDTMGIRLEKVAVADENVIHDRKYTQEEYDGLIADLDGVEI